MKERRIVNEGLAKHLLMSVSCLVQRLIGRVEECLACLEENTCFRAVIFILLVFLIGGSVWMMNVHTPLMLDDYDFMISWATGEKLTGLADIVNSQRVHYQQWGGRLVQSFTQLFLYLGKDVFNVSNTIMYILLLLEIYAIARPKRCFCWTMLLAEHLVMMTMIPFFGTVYLWLCGSCNYLWGTAMALLPILVMRNLIENGWMAKSKIGGLCCLMIGILGGWSNENTTLGMIAVGIAVVIWTILKDERMNNRFYILLVGQCMGAMILLLAPGNFARASIYSYHSMLLEILRRLVMVTAYTMSYLGLLMAAVCLLGAFTRDWGGRRGWATILVLGAVVASYALVGSPELSDRSFTAPMALALASMMVLVGDAEERVRRVDAAKICALPLALVFLMYTSYHALGEIKAHEQAWNVQIATVEKAVAEGSTEVQIESIPSYSRFTHPIMMAQDAGTWPNTSISKIYGIDVNGR